jgi:hypothetical protein
MNWLVFTLLAWIFMGLEVGLKDALAIGPLGIAPSFVLVLLTVVAMSARAPHALWAAFMMGVLLDLTNSIPTISGPALSTATDTITAAGGGGGGPAITILGPYAFGCPLAAQLIISLRALMIRRNPLTVGFLSAVCGLVITVVLVAILSIRSRFDPIVWDASQALLVHAASALYTGVVGIVVALALVPIAPLLGMPTQPQRRVGRW